MIQWIDRYGEAIERDLHERFGVDMIGLIRCRSWRKMYNLIGSLPRSSAFMQARMDDPEVAAAVIQQPESSAPSRPDVSEFTPTVAALYVVADRLAEVMRAIVVTNGGKSPTVKPLSRPVTEIDRARARAGRSAHNDLVAEVMAAQERFAARKALGD